MRFGIYVHETGSTWLDQTAGTLHCICHEHLKDAVLSDFDGLFISFRVASLCPGGFRMLKRKVRRDYKMKIITGGANLFKCLIELDVELSDSDLVAAADTEDSLFEFTKRTVIRCLPIALKEFEEHSLRVVEAAVSAAKLPHQPRW